MAKVNYTDEMVTFAKETYTIMKSEGATNEQIFSKILADERFKDKNERSLRSKLVREEVYVQEEKTRKNSSKDNLPSKKDLLAELVRLTDNENFYESLKNAAKDGIKDIIDLFENNLNSSNSNSE